MQPTNTFKSLTVILAIAVMLLSGITYFLVKKNGGLFENANPPLKGFIPSFEEDNKSSAKQGGVIGQREAFQAVAAYRDNSATPVSPGRIKMSAGLWHDAASLKEYLDSNYKRFVDAHPVPEEYRGFEWRIGFYNTFSYDFEGKLKLSSCLIPTLVNDSLPASDTSKVKDYFRYRFNTKVYPTNPGSEKKKHLTPPECPECFIYDTGEIWP